MLWFGCREVKFDLNAQKRPPEKLEHEELSKISGIRGPLPVGSRPFLVVWSQA